MSSAIRSALKPEDMVLLGRYVHDGCTQREIAKEHQMPQQTVSYRIHRAVRALNDLKLGEPIKLPGRGRRRSSPRATSLDPHQMEHLLADEEGDIMTGSFVKADKRDWDQNDRLGHGRRSRWY